MWWVTKTQYSLRLYTRYSLIGFMEPMLLVMVALLNAAILATMMTKTNAPLSGVERRKIMLNKDFKHRHIRWLVQHRRVTTYEDDYDYSEKTRVKVTTSIFATPAKLLEQIMYHFQPVGCPYEWNRIGYDEAHIEQNYAEGFMWMKTMLKDSALSQIFQAFYKRPSRRMLRKENILNALGFNYDGYYCREHIDEFLGLVEEVVEGGYEVMDDKYEGKEDCNNVLWEPFTGWDMARRIGLLTPLLKEIFQKFKTDFAKSFDEIEKGDYHYILYMLPFCIQTYDSYDSSETLTVTPLRRLTNDTIDSICMCEDIRLDETTHDKEYREYCEYEESEEGQKEIAAAEKAHAERMADLATFMGESGLSSYSSNEDGTYTCW